MSLAMTGSDPAAKPSIDEGLRERLRSVVCRMRCINDTTDLIRAQIQPGPSVAPGEGKDVETPPLSGIISDLDEQVNVLQEKLTHIHGLLG